MRAHGLAERTTRERPRVVRAAACLISAPAHQLANGQIVDYLADLPDLPSPGTRQTYYSTLRPAQLARARRRPGGRLDDGHASATGAPA